MGFKPYYQTRLKTTSARMLTSPQPCESLRPTAAGNEWAWAVRDRYVCDRDSHTRTGRPRASAISTSYVERQNLTMRMQMRRFTRLTNAFSKEVGKPEGGNALHFAHYNLSAFTRLCGSRRNGRWTHPAGLDSQEFTGGNLIAINHT